MLATICLLCNGRKKQLEIVVNLILLESVADHFAKISARLRARIERGSVE